MNYYYAEDDEWFANVIFAGTVLAREVIDFDGEVYRVKS